MEKLTELRTAEEQEKYEAEKQKWLDDISVELNKNHKEFIRLMTEFGFQIPEKFVKG
jgi:hypothetical protein